LRQGGGGYFSQDLVDYRVGMASKNGPFGRFVLRTFEEWSNYYHFIGATHTPYYLIELRQPLYRSLGQTTLIGSGKQ